MTAYRRKIVCLTGGVGGAKLAVGLSQLVPPCDLVMIVNTGDDFEHLGLSISPDIDTLLYSLAGLSNDVLGWGRIGETWSFMETVGELDGPGWFQLGDRDLAMHVLRSFALKSGDTLSSVTARFARNLNIESQIFPMSDQPVRTIIETSEGEIAFQRYFVALGCEPSVSGVRFEGVAAAQPAPGVLEAIARADAILIAPSNPYLSIDPIVSISKIHAALQEAKAPVIAVSPIIGGKAIKGPTAKLMTELGIAVDNESIANHYAGLIHGLLIDTGDDCGARGIVVDHAPTLMTTREQKITVARAALALATACTR